MYKKYEFRKKSFTYLKKKISTNKSQIDFSNNFRILYIGKRKGSTKSLICIRLIYFD